MSKKMGLADGVIIGSGFFLGYFLTKCFVAVLLITIAIWGCCSIAAYHESRGRVNPVTHKLLQINDKVQMVTFAESCALRSAPKTSADVTDFTIAGSTYKVIDKKGSWKQIITFGLNTGWTRCPVGKPKPSSQPSSRTTRKTKQSVKITRPYKIAAVEPKVVHVQCNEPILSSR